jgi:hypothetical protein
MILFQLTLQEHYIIRTQIMFTDHSMNLDEQCFCEVQRISHYYDNSEVSICWIQRGITSLNLVFQWYVRGGADKSLARPGRKQATATKLGIYSTYSPQSSIHFLAHCSNFCQPLKKKFRKLSVQPGLCGSNDLHVGWKMATFQ